MADTAITQGHVIGWTEPKEGTKGPYRCYVGGVELTLWKTVKDDEGDFIKNPFVGDFKTALSDKTALKVKYETSKSKDGRFTNNTPVGVKGADDEDEIAKGDAASEKAYAERQARSGQKKGSYDDSGQAARWAVSHVVETLGDGFDLTKDATKKSIVKNATALAVIALEVQNGIREAQAKAAGKGPQNSAAEIEPEKKEVPADSF